MTPREFFAEVTLPNLQAFKQAYESRVAAFNVIAAVDSLAAHIFWWLKANTSAVSDISDDSHFRNELAKLSPDFALVRDVAKAMKHVQLNRHAPLVSTAAQIAPKKLGYGQGFYGEGRYNTEQVYVILDDGKHRSVETIADRSLTLLIGEMDKFGIP